MESLLQWSIANSSSTAAAPSSSTPAAPRQPLDPGVIDAILGKSDSDLMLEDMTIIMNASLDSEEREEALDHFEMLIESIDNANNMERLNLWTPLHSLLSVSPPPPQGVLLQVLWVLGTALQNNPQAQDAYMSLSPSPVLTLLSILSSSSNAKIRAKTLYALSGLAKHNAPAVQQFDWAVLKGGLEDPDLGVRRKTIFLLSTLLHPTTLPGAEDLGEGIHAPTNPDAPAAIHANSHAAHLRAPSRADTSKLTLQKVQEEGIVGSVLGGLLKTVPYGVDGDGTEPDVDFEEKCVEFLRTYLVDHKASFATEDRSALKAYLDKQGKAENVGLGEEEFRALMQVLQ